MPSNKQRVAMVEDVDDQDNVVVDSQRYAKSTVASAPGSPIKQQMNTGRKKSSRRVEASSPSESDSTEQASSSSRHREKEKRSSRSSKGKEVVLEKRPVIRSMKTTPSRSRHAEEAAYYGVTEQRAIPASSRPHTVRPQSYYGPSRPPLSYSAHFHPGPPGPPTSFPPPQWMGPAPNLGSSPLAPSPIGMPTDYFHRDTDALASRFSRGEHRPQSAMGHRVGSYGSSYDHYEVPPPPPQKLVVRQSSLSKRAAKDQEDRARMPPPSRPQTVQPPRQGFRPPPQPQPRPRKSVGFDESDFMHDESDMYRDVDRRNSIDFMKALPHRPKRQSTGADYFDQDYSLEPAISKARREDRRSASYSVDDRVKNASRYQEEVNGGPGTALTPENLRRALKRGGSSRSTRSSASRDESSYKQSATTRTTRSGSNDDDITIKVPHGAVVEVGNAKINCTKGGEINIGRSGMGSDRGTVYDDESRSRALKSERPPTRTRASSQSVYSRRPRALPSPNPSDQAGYGDYAPSYPHHHSEFSHYPPPYPPYPQTHYDFDDSYSEF